MKIHAASRPHDDTTAEAHRWTVEGDDYDQLYTQGHAAAPDGWVLLSVQVERDAEARVSRTGYSRTR